MITKKDGLEFFLIHSPFSQTHRLPLLGTESDVVNSTGEVAMERRKKRVGSIRKRKNRVSRNADDISILALSMHPENTT